jgi:hypothetical protein
MNWLNKLERRLGFLAIPNVIIYVVGGQALATLFAAIEPRLLDQMVLDPAAVMHGEVWRLFTFVLVPSSAPGSPLSVIFALLWLYFLWIMGKGLEQQWGDFKLTAYLGSGLLFQALVSMGLWTFGRISVMQTGFYWTLSIQLAFAYLYPDFTIYLYMILPVKMRWMAWFLGALMIFQVVTGGLGTLILVLAGMANYLLFFGPDYFINWKLRQGTAQTRAKMQASVSRAMASGPKKSCSSCGKGPSEADLRLCTCERCGEDGKFWCTEDVAIHLGKS